MDQAVRWGALLGYVAVLSALSFLLPMPDRVEETFRTTTEEPTKPVRPDRFTHPTAVAEPKPEEVARLAEAARPIEPSMMCVGTRGGDSGSAFVISRTNRLLLTSAHVAKIIDEVGELSAIRSGTQTAYKVEKVWYHPEFPLTRRDGVSLRTDSGWIRYRGGLSSDLAVLKLAEGGPDLPTECLLARDLKSVDLSSMPVGLLGFAGNSMLPDQPVDALFRSGAVCFVTDFAPPKIRQPRWGMIDFSSPNRSGDSGGPVFLADGRVIAVFCWCRINDHDAECSMGIRIDALWELLEEHGLKHLVAGP